MELSIYIYIFTRMERSWLLKPETNGVYANLLPTADDGETVVQRATAVSVAPFEKSSPHLTVGKGCEDRTFLKRC